MLIHIIRCNTFISGGFIINGKMVDIGLNIKDDARPFEEEDIEARWQYVDVDI